MESEGGVSVNEAVVEVKPGTNSLRTTVAIEHGYLSSLRKSEKPGNRVQASVMMAGKAEGSLGFLREQGETISVRQVLEARLMSCLAVWTAKKAGWDSYEVEEAFQRGKSYGIHEEKLIKETGEDGFEAWSKLRLAPRVLAELERRGSQ